MSLINATPNSGLSAISNSVDTLVKTEIHHQTAIDTSIKVFQGCAKEMQQSMQLMSDQSQILQKKVIALEVSNTEMTTLNAAQLISEQLQLDALQSEFDALVKEHAGLALSIESQKKAVEALTTTNSTLKSTVAGLAATNTQYKKSLYLIS